MKIRLYKVIELDDYSNENDFEKTQVMSEKELRKEFAWALDNRKIPEQLVVDYQVDPDYAKENWKDMTGLSIGTIIDMMNDICNYDCGGGYYILETDVEL